MRSIVATQHHYASRKMRVSVYKDDRLIGGEIVDPGKTSEIRKKLCNAFQLKESDVLQALGTPDVPVLIPEPTDTPVEPIKFTIRAKRSTDFIESTLPLDEVFQQIFPTDTLLSWDDTRLCCLDIDVDSPIDDPARVASLVRPRPALWHSSRNGGLHLYYDTALGFVAADLAACAAVWVRQHNSAWRCELKNVTH